MSLFDLFHRREPEPEPRADYLPAAAGLFNAIGVNDALALDISAENAMTCTAVYAAISVIASAVGTLPIHLRDRKTGEQVHDHPIAQLLNHPNEFMGWPDAAEAFTVNLLATGNGYGYVERDEGFDPIAFYPLKSLNVAPRRSGGQLVYDTIVNGQVSTVPALSLVHARGLSWDGVTGMSPLHVGGGAVNLALHLQRFALKFFTNGANVRNIVSAPTLSQDGVAKLARAWQSEYTGTDQAHRTVFTDHDLKVLSLGFSPDDSQAIEQRRFQLLEVARIFQIPPHMLGDLERATFSNIEEQQREFYEGCVRRWVVKIEQALEHTLLREDERDKYSIRFNLAARIRGTFQSQIEALTKATGGAPVFTQNEARDYLGKPPMAGGDVLLTNLNQAPAATRALRSTLRYLGQSWAVKETNAVGRAAKKHANDPEAFEAWASQFYQSHMELISRAVEGCELPPELVAEYCDSQRSGAVEAFAAGEVEERGEAVKKSTDELIHRIIEVLEKSGSEVVPIRAYQHIEESDHAA